MNLKSGLATALVAAIVSAVVTVLLVGSLAFWPKGPMQQLVSHYLTSNPEILVAMTNELDRRQAVEQEAQQQKAIGSNAEKIFRSSASFVGGNPDGDVSVVEFFDYNCGYCKRALPDVMKLINDDNKVRLVLKELPIFGEDSEAAAKVALAAKKQGKYLEMHQKLFTEPGKANLDKALSIAGELGLDVDQLKKDMQDPEIEEALKENRSLAEALGAQGTPYYVIGDIILAGAPEDLHDQLTQKISEIRKNGCRTTC
jgi:protein-disulfide isomerase